MTLSLNHVLEDIANSLVEIDASGVPHSHFQPGVGPYGEPQVVKLIANRLNGLEGYVNKVATKRTPDLLISGTWAIEYKIARPFGDNGKPAENWSVNLLHPYPGNTSLLGDCMKLAPLRGPERKAAVAIGYEHTPPVINLDALLASFEVVARQVLSVRLGYRVETTRLGLVHPVHQQLRVCGWEVL